MSPSSSTASTLAPASSSLKVTYASPCLAASCSGVSPGLAPRMFIYMKHACNLFKYVSHDTDVSTVSCSNSCPLFSRFNVSLRPMHGTQRGFVVLLCLLTQRTTAQQCELGALPQKAFSVSPQHSDLAVCAWVCEEAFVRCRRGHGGHAQHVPNTTPRFLYTEMVQPVYTGIGV